MGDNEIPTVLLSAFVLDTLARLTYRHFAHKQQWVYGVCCSCPGLAFMIPVPNQTSWPSTEYFSSHTSVGCSFCGQWRMFSFRAVKVYGLAIRFGFRTHLRIWDCEGSCFWDCFHPLCPLLGLWHYLIPLQVCLLSHDSTECQVREQKQSLKAKSLEAFMGALQGCPALEGPPEFSPRFHFWKSSRPSLQSSVLNLKGLIHLTTISQTIQILVR